MQIKFFKLILPLSLVAVAVIMGAVFLLNQSPESQPTPNPSQSPTPAPTPQPVAEVPDNWQTYRNEKFGFEVKYPNDLTLLKEDTSTFVSFGKPDRAFIGESSLDIKILKDVSEKKVLSEARIWTKDEIIELHHNEPKQFPPDFNAEEFTKTQEYWFFDPVDPYPTPVQEILVDGKKALTGEFSVRLGDAQGGYLGLGTNSMILLYGNDNTYALIYAGFNADSVVLPKILSTFQFIE
ncbi:MAG: hypothetical protein AAB524_03195 [Patescibacteria group bacterium]